MSEPKYRISELLEKRGFIEVLVAVGIERHTRWTDIVRYVISKTSIYSPSTIKNRLNDLEEIKFIEKQLKVKSRDEYTYHATELGTKTARIISKMILQLENEDYNIEIEFSTEIWDDIIDLTVKGGYDSVNDFLVKAIEQFSANPKKRKKEKEEQKKKT
ncbi:MAG: hypothetical protein ACTSQE_14510 [Candidatus Heimdallarchaeaceae archaeon]